MTLHWRRSSAATQRKFLGSISNHQRVGLADLYPGCSNGWELAKIGQSQDLLEPLVIVLLLHMGHAAERRVHLQQGMAGSPHFPERPRLGECGNSAIIIGERFAQHLGRVLTQ
jgi:hypothetical protein